MSTICPAPRPLIVADALTACLTLFLLQTEASKKIMSYIAAVTGNDPLIEDVKNKMLASNPLLEALGNSRTQRNNNSSRFGKYMEIFFDYKGDPVGGRIQNFLLEKSRVIHQLPEERSFHIFYMMLEGCTAAQRQSLRLLSSAAEYGYLNKNGCYKVDRMNDHDEFRLCLDSMAELGISAGDIDLILRILSSVLWLGQLEFTSNGSDKDKSTIVDNRPIEVIAELLACDAKLLAQGMTQRTYAAANSAVLTPLNVDQAKYTRDALAKAIYFRLFDYIVFRINDAIHSSSGTAAVGSSKKTKSTRTIAVLDIYGFEIFQNNGFEQVNHTTQSTTTISLSLSLSRVRF